MKTTSYEISKQLAEAGFNKNHNYHYRFGCDTGWVIEIGLASEKCGDIPAYDLETILEALPQQIEHQGKTWREELTWELELNKEFIEYSYYYSCQSDIDKESLFSCIKLHQESLADTAARLWLKLKKEGLV